MELILLLERNKTQVLCGEYSFVMKQLTQVEDEKALMLSVAKQYGDEHIKAKFDAKYGEGAADFLVQAIEVFYKQGT